MAQRVYVTIDEMKQMNLCSGRYRHLMRNIEFDDADEVRVPLALVLEVNGPTDLKWLLYQARIHRVPVVQDLLKSVPDRVPYSDSTFGLPRRCSLKEATDTMRRLLKGVTRP